MATQEDLQQFDQQFGVKQQDDLAKFDSMFGQQETPDLQQFDTMFKDKYQSKIYQLADFVTNSLPNKAYSREIAKYVPKEEREQLLQAVYQLGQKKGTWSRLPFEGRAVGGLMEGMLELTGVAKRAVSLEPEDKELTKFSEQLDKVWKSADPVHNPDAPWYDPFEAVVSAAAAAPSLLLAGGAGRAAGAGAKAVGLGEKAIKATERIGAGLSFAPKIYEDTYDALLSDGVAPGTAKWAAATSSGLQSALFSGLPKKLLPKSWTSNKISKQLSDSLVANYVKTTAIYGPTTMAGSKAVDMTVKDFAEGEFSGVKEYWNQIAGTYLHSIGTMGVLGVPTVVSGIIGTGKSGRKITIERLKEEAILPEIEKAIKNDTVPSRDQMTRWDIPVEGKNNRENRYTAFKKFASNYKQQKASAGFYLGKKFYSYDPLSKDFNALKYPVSEEMPKEELQPVSEKFLAEQLTETGVQEQKPPEQVSPEQVTEVPIQKPVDNVVSLADQVVNEIRTKRGETELPKPVKESFAQWMDDAEKQIKADPEYINKLTKDLKESNRAPNPNEIAALQYQYRRANNLFNDYSSRLNEAVKSGDKTAIDRVQMESNVVLNEIRSLEEFTKPEKTLAGRTLAAWAIALQEDYSPATLTNRAQVAKGEQPLTLDDKVQIGEIGKNIQNFETRLKTAEDRISKLSNIKDIERTIQELAPKKTLRKSSAQKETAKKNIETAWNEFNELFKSKDVSLKGLIKGESGAFDPEMLIAAGKIVKSYLDYGVVSFRELMENAKQKFGEKEIEKSRDILLAAWNTAKEKQETPQLKLDIEKPKSISDTARKIAKGLIESGVTDREDLVNTVHKEIQQYLPEFTAEQTADAMSRRGMFEIAKKPTEPEAYKKGLYKRLATWKEKITEKQFTKPSKEERVLSQEELDLRFQIAQEKSKFKAMEYRWQEEQKPAWIRTVQIGPELIRTSRALMTSIDLSAVLRQGGIITAGHPLLSMSEFRPMFQALASEKGMFKIMHEIESRENSKKGWYDDSGLNLATTEGRLSQMEEVFMGRIAPHIPGIRLSERAYITFLNKLRADTFDLLCNRLVEPTVQDRQAIANYINVATGRGPLTFFGYNFESAAVPLANILFSPRLAYSRFQYLLGQPFFKGTARTRKLILEEYVRSLIGAGTFYGSVAMAAAYLFDDKDKYKPYIETNSRSSNFGKIKIGNTWIDPLAGLSQSTVLLSRLITGKTKAGTGELVSLRGEDKPWTGSGEWDVITHFLRGKLAPGAGTAIDVITGENIVGEPISLNPTYAVENIKGTFKQQKGREKEPIFAPYTMVVPLSMRDIYDAMQDQGVAKGSALSLLILLGMGSSTYYKPLPGDYAKKIAQHEKLYGFSKKTRKVYDYREEVSDIIKQAKKFNLEETEMVKQLESKLIELGYKPKAISEWKQRFLKRYRAGS